MNRILGTSALLCCFNPLASATVIDFEGLLAGRIIDDEYADDVNVRVENYGGGPDVGVVFNTNQPTGGDVDLGGPFDSLNDALQDRYRPGNVLIIHERYDCGQNYCDEPDDEGSRRAGAFFFDFVAAVTLESIDFFDVETDENGSRPENAIRLFDAADNEIMPGMFYTPDTGGDNMWGQLEFNVGGVKRIELNMGGSGAIDNITYSVIPIPSAVWLFGSGLVGLVVLARRKS